MQRTIKRLSKYPVFTPIINYIIRKSANRKAANIAKHFGQYLEPVYANSTDKYNECFHIRHQVYCEEHDFLPPSEDRLETDACDEHSYHLLLQQSSSENYTGTIRVVYSDDDSQLLPIEKYCAECLESSDPKPSDFPRDSICELSRVAVLRDFRRRKIDRFDGAATGDINSETYSEEELRCFPFIAIGLYLSAANVILHNNHKHCFMMMEPRLARSMSFIGLTFNQIGPVINYHGKRAPYYINPRLFDETLPGDLPGCMSILVSDWRGSMTLALIPLDPSIIEHALEHDA